MIYILTHFLYFLGLGSYFSSLSPFVIQHYGNSSYIIFLAGQISFPIGYFLIGYLSDRFHKIRLFLIFALLLQVPVQFLLFSTTDNLWLATLLNGTIRFLFAFIFQLSALSALEAKGTVHYGRIRAWGTVGFLVVQLSFFILESGYLSGIWTPGEASSTSIAGRLGAFSYLLALIPALWIQKSRLSPEQYFFEDALRIILQPINLIFFGLSFVFFFSYQMVDYYLGRFFANQGGMAMVFAGWSLAVLLEIPFMPLSARFYHRYGPEILFMISGGAGVLRFVWLSGAILGFDSLPVIYSQILHGIHFTGYYMGSIYWLRRAFPDHLYGTGYGTYQVLSVSIGGAVGNWFFGRVLFSDFMERWGLFAKGTLGGENLSFLPLFFGAALIQFLIFFSFLFLRLFENKRQNRNRELHGTPP